MHSQVFHFIMMIQKESSTIMPLPMGCILSDSALDIVSVVTNHRFSVE